MFQRYILVSITGLSSRMMNHVSKVKEVRNSAIELLKIVAIIGIVFGHISGGIAFPAVINGIKLNEATWNFSHITLQLTTFLGQIGNNIFWICSCWFLVGDNRMSKRKLFGIILDTWLISVIILCFCLYTPQFCDSMIMPMIISNVSLKYGYKYVPAYQVLDEDIHIYPSDTFSSLYDFSLSGKQDYHDLGDNELRFAYHIVAHSWYEGSGSSMIYKIKHLMIKIFGKSAMNKLKKVVHGEDDIMRSMHKHRG